MDFIALTKKLISTPSYVDKTTNEGEIGIFLYKYLKQIPFLTKIKKQKVEGERFNIVASDGANPRLLLTAHLDTVEPRGWQKQNPFKGMIEGNKLCGLGSMDMKGGIAAILCALKEFKKTKGLMLLFYCDEEYDFKGMEKFVNEYKISPQLVVSSEPTNLKIWNGARGIIKVSFGVSGLTAPASRPDQGKNAILGLIEAVKYLTQKLKKYQDKYLGLSTCNLAAVLGGLNLGQNKTKNLIISRKGDAVADIAEATLDIRSGHLNLKANIIQKILTDFLIKKGFKLTNFVIQHDLGAFYIKPQKLKLVERVIKNTIGKVEYLDLWQMGYQDIQMIHKKLGVPTISFGPEGSNRHKPNEWVDIRSLDKTKKVYQNLIREYCPAL